MTKPKIEPVTDPTPATDIDQSTETTPPTV